MKWSRLHIPTLRETPAEAESVHQQLLQRAGYLRQNSHLFLSNRSLQKIAGIVRAALDALGAQEIGLADGAAVASIARGELRSYKQLPQIWCAGRRSERIDCFWFDLADPAEHLRAACRGIFARCGLPYLEGSAFLVAAAGGDLLAATTKSGFAEPYDTAAAQPSAPVVPDPESNLEPELFHTPGQKTIADVSSFTGLPHTSQMKTLVMVADGALHLLLLRGDHQLSEAKFKSVTGASKVRPATPEEVHQALGAAPGSLGPLGVAKIPVWADLALQGRRNLICGANRDDYHMRNVTPDEDFQPRWCDLRLVCEGDTVAGEPLQFAKAFELGRVARLDSAGLRVLDQNGKEADLALGSATVALDRVLYAAAELCNDANGLCLPRAIAPFEVVITPVNIGDAALREAAIRIYGDCKTAGIDALLDDRDERPGVKFKDAELIGVPWRVTVGKKLAEGKVELVERRSRETREVEVDRVVEALKE